MAEKRMRLDTQTRGSLLLALFVFLVAIPQKWMPSPFPEKAVEGCPGACLRVEVIGESSLEGIYEIPRGTTVGGFLRSLGVRSLQGRDARLSFPLEDLQAIRLLEEGHWRLEPMAPGKAFLLGAPMDVNRADVRELCMLPGVGPVTARRIVAYRRRHGPFEGPEALAGVPGLRSRTLARIRPLVSFGGEAASRSSS